MPGVARKTAGVGGVATPSFHVSPEYVLRNFFWFGNVPRASLESFWRPTGARWWFREEREGCARDGDLQVVVTRRVT
mgnify:CR=1 FL=1